MRLVDICSIIKQLNRISPGNITKQKKFDNFYENYKDVMPKAMLCSAIKIYLQQKPEQQCLVWRVCDLILLRQIKRIYRTHRQAHTQ